MLNKGFALLELLVTMTILSILFLFIQYGNVNIDYSYYTFSSQYLFKQSQAMLESKMIELEDTPIHFNAKGNVNGARTILFNQKEIVVQLGGGRLVHR